MLLLAGDLTRSGTITQAYRVAAEVGGVGIPVVAVLGNHDHQSDRASEVAGILTAAGIRILEGSGVVLAGAEVRLGVAGCTGFGGGFAGTAPPEPGADRLAAALAGLDCDLRVALTHYAPVAGTLAGEPFGLYERLGSERLGQAIDRSSAALAVHGHAHHGAEFGVTPGGVPVRNVAFPVIRTAYRVYTLDRYGRLGGADHGSGGRPSVCPVDL